MQKEHKIMTHVSLEELGKSEIKVGGWSMWPFIRNNDIIQVIKNSEKLSRGVVVVFFIKKQLIAHRVVKLITGNNQDNKLLVQGDFETDAKTCIDKNEVIGKIHGIKDGSFFRNIWFTPPYCRMTIVLGFLCRFIFKSKLFKFIEAIKIKY